MIQFRCWYCNKRYSVSESRDGEIIDCTCERRLKVPREDGGYCRVKTLVDWLVEALVYGGGGALLGLGLGLLLLRAFLRGGFVLLGSCMLLGFLAGLLGGERGVNWIGQMIRDREER